MVHYGHFVGQIVAFLFIALTPSVLWMCVGICSIQNHPQLCAEHPRSREIPWKWDPHSHTTPIPLL